MPTLAQKIRESRRKPKTPLEMEGERLRSQMLSIVGTIHGQLSVTVATLHQSLMDKVLQYVESLEPDDIAKLLENRAQFSFRKDDPEEPNDEPTPTAEVDDSDETGGHQSGDTPGGVVGSPSGGVTQ